MKQGIWIIGYSDGKYERVNGTREDAEKTAEEYKAKTGADYTIV